MILISLCLDFGLHEGSDFFQGMTGRRRIQGKTRTGYHRANYGDSFMSVIPPLYVLYP